MPRLILQRTYKVTLLSIHAVLRCESDCCRGRRAITASLGAIMALCVMISIVMVAQPAALLATDMTLSKGLMKAGKVRAYPSTAAEAP